jgi:hypothetical protein
MLVCQSEDELSSRSHLLARMMIRCFTAGTNTVAIGIPASGVIWDWSDTANGEMLTSDREEARQSIYGIRARSGWCSMLKNKPPIDFCLCCFRPPMDLLWPAMSQTVKMHMGKEGEPYCALVDVAWRLEPATYSEAPTERSIGETRRFLLPQQTAMKPDLLWRGQTCRFAPSSRMTRHR